MIDLRSDTVTKPGKAMLSTMMNADVGDDVYGEDPEINKLEKYAADLFGMEAALFCPSGTMTNQIAINVHTRPGDEVICYEHAHIYNYEGAGMAANSGCQPRLIASENGRFTADDVLDCIQPPDPHAAHTKLVSIENTCNKAGGTVWDLNEIKKISLLCKERNLKFHLDGARLFNALAATGEKPSDYGRLFDSVSICLSKGLGAPAGSLLLGEKDFIYEAHRVRKRTGGGMRQAGFLAAAGIYALNNNRERLKVDHKNAVQIADALKQSKTVLNVNDPETNIVLFKVRDVNAVLQKLKSKGIKAGPMGKNTVRFVTHLNISHQDVERVCEVAAEL